MKLEELNARFNAFITIHTTRGASRGSLSGLTLGLKDLIFTKGVRTTAGSKILWNFVPTSNASIVERILGAGGTVVGKTNTHEFAAGPTNTSSFAGPARNPRDPQKISGGSSGGSAVAVGAGMVDVAIGTDTGGSVRIPAALCGVIGFKPTQGLIPTEGVIPLSWSLDTVGVLAKEMGLIRRVSRILFDSEHRQALLPSRRPKRRFKLGLFLFSEDEVSRGLRAAIERLSNDFELVDVDFPLLREKGPRTRRDFTLAEAAAYHREWLGTRADDYFPDVRRLLTIGSSTSAVDYIDAFRLRRLMIREYLRGIANVDAVISPTTKIVAPGIDAVTSHEIDYRQSLITNTELFNVVAAPSISVPAGELNGLPMGLMVSGEPYRDGALLDVAERIMKTIGKK